MIHYNNKTRQINIPFPNYQIEIEFSKYEKVCEKKEIKLKNPSQLELKLK